MYVFLKNKDKQNKRFQPHFRKAYNGKFTGHPQYVYGEDGMRYKILGLTSSPITNGVYNVRLKENPEPHNSAPSYVRPNPDKEKKGAFGERLKGWKFSSEDKKTVKNIINKSGNKKH